MNCYVYWICLKKVNSEEKRVNLKIFLRCISDNYNWTYRNF